VPEIIKKQRMKVARDEQYVADTEENDFIPFTKEETERKR